MAPQQHNKVFTKVWFYHVGRRDFFVGEVVGYVNTYGEVLTDSIGYSIVSYNPSPSEGPFLAHVRPTNIVYPT